MGGAPIGTEATPIQESSQRLIGAIGLGIVRNFYFAALKLRADFKSAAHSFDHTAQALNTNIVAAFHFGDGWLIHVKTTGKFFLRSPDCLA